LHEALKSSDLLTRIGAIRAIQETPGDEYVQALCEALDDQDRLVRVNAAIGTRRCNPTRSGLTARSIIRRHRPSSSSC
jgi:HEAT repeat protein